MTQAKMETSAERYRRIKAERAANQETFTVEMPSGMTWVLRKLDVAQFVISGTMPMALATKLAEASAEANGDGVKAFSTLSPNEQIKTIDFSQKAVRYCAVNPRIVENPTQTDEIGFDEVELDDFNAILAWATQGGAEVNDGLDTFRSE